jgi:CheY-like chemotaxis protein
VTAVGSVASAIAALRDTCADVVISDIAMPGGDGYSLIRGMRELPSMPPAIALSAYGDSQDAELLVRAGFDLYLSKPVEPATLLASVARLARARGTSESEARSPR